MLTHKHVWCLSIAILLLAVTAGCGGGGGGGNVFVGTYRIATVWKLDGVTAHDPDLDSFTVVVAGTGDMTSPGSMSFHGTANFTTRLINGSGVSRYNDGSSTTIRFSGTLGNLLGIPRGSGTFISSDGRITGIWQAAKIR